MSVLLNNSLDRVIKHKFLLNFNLWVYILETFYMTKWEIFIKDVTFTANYDNGCLKDKQLMIVWVANWIGHF